MHRKTRRRLVGQSGGGSGGQRDLTCGASIRRCSDCPAAAATLPQQCCHCQQRRRQASAKPSARLVVGAGVGHNQQARLLKALLDLVGEGTCGFESSRGAAAGEAACGSSQECGGGAAGACPLRLPLPAPLVGCALLHCYSTPAPAERLQHAARAACCAGSMAGALLGCMRRRLHAPCAGSCLIRCSTRARHATIAWRHSTLLLHPTHAPAGHPSAPFLLAPRCTPPPPSPPPCALAAASCSTG